MSLTHCSELIACSEDMGPTICRFYINIVAIPIDLNIDIPTQVETDFILKEYKIWAQNTVMCCPQKQFFHS
jgi:hypothetical protein